MNTHELKILPEYYHAVASNEKTFEIRKNDRNFQVGDMLILKEWKDEEYTGRHLVRYVSYILFDWQAGLKDGYCIMSIKDVNCGNCKFKDVESGNLEFFRCYHITYPCSACESTYNKWEPIDYEVKSMSNREALNHLKDILRLIGSNRGKGKIVTFSDSDSEAVSIGIKALERCIKLEDDGK